MEIRTETQRCLVIVKELWLSSSEERPDFLETVPEQKKAENEKYIKGIQEEINKQVNHLPRLPFRRKQWKRKTFRLIQSFLYHEAVIGIHDAMKTDEIDAFYEELEEFLRKVRKLSPKLSFADIGQATRNYIVYAMFKVIHQVSSGFSQAGFGYSMLYPVTDNYIDNGMLSSEEKKEYNQFIRDTIQGKEVSPASDHQKKTYDLLKAIEADYPRDQHSNVYPLLLMMLEAQEESLRQQQQDQLLSLEERLDVSLQKGGISVLVDRFLVNKALTEADLIFYLGFGFFLQLADDLQDIGTDSKIGYQTLFTLSPDSASEERLVNKLLHFLHKIMSTYTAENDRFKNFIMKSSDLLIYTSLMGSRDFFSDEYRARIEQCLPVTPSFLEASQSDKIEFQDAVVQEKYQKLLDLLIKE